MLCFNSRPRAGGNSHRFSVISSLLKVSIHAPVRGATQGNIHGRISYHVSIHAPVRGATFLSHPDPSTFTKFQFTPPCGGQPIQIHLFMPLKVVSIHAPVRGATFNPVSSGIELLVSIHAPVRGATGRNDWEFWRHRNVSIHAPVRGATVT